MYVFMHLFWKVLHISALLRTKLIIKIENIIGTPFTTPT